MAQSPKRPSAATPSEAATPYDDLPSVMSTRSMPIPMPVSMPSPSPLPSPLPSTSPAIAVQQHLDVPHRPTLAPHVSAPPNAVHFQSPMRHHKRTPSQHREVKETLNARTEYTNDEADGRSQHTVNQYTIREEIGRGSYGAVHLATDQAGKEYAMKEFSKMRLRKRVQSNILRRPEGGRPSHLAPGRGQWNTHKKKLSQQNAEEARDALFLIREEIAIMKKLNHPNLVALIEVLDDPEEDSLYMVLEMCRKGPVMKVNLEEQADPYDDEHCWTWFRDLILGIEYLHAQGIVHRDIKPDNLLLTEDDVLKIVDFGVSEMFEKPDQMLTHKSAGSPAFLPPELCQAKHGDVSGKGADIWSMGVTLYCLKYGKLPFEGDNVLDMYNSIRMQELHLPDGEDPDFVDLITRILDKDNATRIKLPEIRVHPWVTKRDSDPLLPEEENCSDMVEAPNELEVNHAFTRKMDHLLYVLRAIHRFKGLAAQSQVKAIEAAFPRTSSARETVSEETDSETDQKPATRPRHKSVADEAAELVEQRRAYLATSPLASRHTVPVPVPVSGPGGRGHAHDPTEKPTPLLGIGVGGRDDFSHHESPAQVVSDSPTGIEFDIYDRAFETEIKRIRSNRRKGRARTYLTRLVGEQEIGKYLGDDCMVVEAGKSLASNALTRGSAAASRGLTYVHGHGHDAGGATTHEGDSRGMSDTRQAEGQEGVRKLVETAKDTTHKLADLVTSLTKDVRGGPPAPGH